MTPNPDCPYCHGSGLVMMADEDRRCPRCHLDSLLTLAPPRSAPDQKCYACREPITEDQVRVAVAYAGPGINVVLGFEAPPANLDEVPVEVMRYRFFHEDHAPAEGTPRDGERRTLIRRRADSFQAGVLRGEVSNFEGEVVES